MTFAKLIKFCDKNGYEVERSNREWWCGSHSKYFYKWTSKKTGYSESHDSIAEAFDAILGDIEDEDENHDICQAN